MVNTINEKIAILEKDKLYDFHPNFRIEKKELLDIALSNYPIQNIVELGCVWGIDCSYGIYAMEKYDLDNVQMVDTHWTEKASKRVASFKKIKKIKNDFSLKNTVDTIGKVDAVIFFDILLHQVAPDWNRILEIYAKNTDYFIIFNQDWIETSLTTRLLDLGEEEYFKYVPHTKEEKPYDKLFENLYIKHPVHNKIWRDVHHIWQWGIVSEDLISTMRKLGFKLQYFYNHGKINNLPSFEEHSYIFKKIIE
ncbi:hypothetical protein ACMC56_15580 [Campylobacterota bacterium DY0563]